MANTADQKADAARRAEDYSRYYNDPELRKAAFEVIRAHEGGAAALQVARDEANRRPRK